MDIREDIQLIENKYYKGGYYSQYRSDEEMETEFDMEKEIIDYFEENDIIYAVDITDAFDSPGYDCSVISISWLENGEIETDNFLLEVR